MDKQIAIIGAGFSGLAAGIRLASMGFDVEIFEKLAKPGGRACGIAINGFRFDTDSGFIHSPQALDDLFAAAGKSRTDLIRLKQVTPACRYFHPDGRSLDISPDPAATAGEIARYFPSESTGYLELVEAIGKITPQVSPINIGSLLPDPIQLARYIAGALQLQIGGSLYAMVSKHVRNEFLREILCSGMLSSGFNPLESGNPGAPVNFPGTEPQPYYPEGGMAQLADTLAGIFIESGGRFSLNMEAASLSLDGRRVRGLVTRDGAFHRADAVISGADTAYTLSRLIPADQRSTWTKRSLDPRNLRPSAFIYNFGTGCSYSRARLAHHNVILPASFPEYCKSLFQDHTLPGDWYITLTMPTRTDRSAAPRNCDTFTAVIAAPNLDHPLEWKTLSRKIRDRLVDFLGKNYLPDLRKNITAEYFMDPPFFSSEFNCLQGSVFGLKPGRPLTGRSLPPVRSNDLENLYFTGAGTQLDAGFEGALSSAETCASFVAEDFLSY